MNILLVKVVCLFVPSLSLLKNNAAMSVTVLDSMQKGTHFSLDVPKIGNAGSQAVHTFNFGRYCQTGLQSQFTTLLPVVQQSFSCSL